MKARDNHRRDILRQVHTELKAIEVNERREVTEADVDAMLKRTIKQTKETLDGSIKAGNNQERTDTLTEQVAILEEYLPRQVEGDELAALIDEVLADTGASTKKDMGRVMGELTKRTGGNFDKASRRQGASAVSWASKTPLPQRKEGLPPWEAFQFGASFPGRLEERVDGDAGHVEHDAQGEHAHEHAGHADRTHTFQSFDLYRFFRTRMTECAAPCRLRPVRPKGR